MSSLTSLEHEMARTTPYGGVLKLPDTAERRPHGSIVLAHGFALSPRSYRELAERWAHEGWAVYVPTLYNICTPVGEETDTLAHACTWAFANLPRPLLLAGHSRGGQAALMHLLRLHKNNTNIERRRRIGPPLGAYRGLLLLDPVEGKPASMFTCALKHVILDAAGIDWRWSDIPVVLVETRGCAPEGHRATALYSALRAATLVGGGNWEYGDAPFYLVDANKFGHMDFLDDSTGPIASIASLFVPGERGKRNLLRRYTADVVRAVFEPGANKRDVRARVAEVERRLANA